MTTRDHVLRGHKRGLREVWGGVAAERAVEGRRKAKLSGEGEGHKRRDWMKEMQDRYIKAENRTWTRSFVQWWPEYMRREK